MIILGYPGNDADTGRTCTYNVQTSEMTESKYIKHSNIQLRAERTAPSVNKHY